MWGSKLSHQRLKGFCNFKDNLNHKNILAKIINVVEDYCNLAHIFFAIEHIFIYQESGVDPPAKFVNVYEK